MATTRSSRAADRRARQAAEGRTERRIYLAAAAIGAVVLAIIVVGVILTVVLPPRSTVVKVGNRTFTARDLATRVTYAVLVERNQAMATDPGSAIPVLSRTEVLHQKAGDLGVGMVTDDELKQELRRKISAAPDLPDADFELAYARYLKTVIVSRSDFESFVKDDVIRQKAADTFKAKIPESGPQIHLLGVTASDRQKAEDLRAAVKSGKDFKAEAVSRGFVQQVEQVDLQWLDPGSLPDGIATISQLKAGEVSEVIPDQRAGGFLLAYMLERDDNRKYEDSVKTQIANRQLLEWLKPQESALIGPTTLTKSAESWVVRQVKSAITEATRRNQEAQKAKK